MPAPVVRAAAQEIAYLGKGLGKTILYLYVPLMAVLTLLHFPRDTDPSLRSGRSATAEAVPAAPLAKQRLADFYEVAYQGNEAKKRGVDYERIAEKAAGIAGIEEGVRKFVNDYQLQNKKVLEVGSGRGYLQDVVPDYTGLDLSSAVAHHYHKPFVAASATNMPFADSSFDVIWSVWVLEHIPEPERALLEMRRVLKPGGLLYLYVAWNCPPWLAEGFEVRPHSDFNWRGKAVKASLAVRTSPYFALLYMVPTRGIRWAQYARSGKDEPLHFRALEPNYETYWQPDSDAAVSLDSYEAHLWFRAHGDTCLNCGTPLRDWMEWRNHLILRIGK